MYVLNIQNLTISSSQVATRIQNLGSGLIAKGYSDSQETAVGIYGKNSPDWNIVMQTCNHYSMRLVPLYDTLGPKAMNYVLTSCALKVVVVDNALLHNILKWVNQGSNIETIIANGPSIPEEHAERAVELGIELITMAEVEKLGSHNSAPPNPPKSEDVALICYTSGTTGIPKGAIITHGNIAACCMGLTDNFRGFTLDHNDVLMSYLPLAHVYEFAVECFFSYLGASVGYSQGDVKLLLDDIAALQPTLFPSVPRVLNKVYDRVVDGIQKKGAVVKMLYNMGLASKLAEVERNIFRTNSIWDAIVFKKVQALFGKRLRLLISGSAPCRGDILQWYRAVLGVYVMEGFGQTEMSGVATMSVCGDHTTGHIGLTLPGLEAKLVDVPEKNAFVSENKGEICFKGATVFRGYHNDPEKTAETVDSEGWLHTGDIGTWTDHGCLSIIDRKKNVFKLAQGEYIAPDKIESVYERCSIVNQCFIYGDSLKSSLVGLVVPSDIAIEAMYEGMTVEEFVTKPDSAGFIMQTIQTLGQNELKSFEQVRHVKLVAAPFSVENDMLTPTFKKRRQAIADTYKDLLEEMLEGMG